MLSTADAQVNNWGTDGSSGHMELKSRMAGAKPSSRFFVVGFGYHDVTLTTSKHGICALTQPQCNFLKSPNHPNMSQAVLLGGAHSLS